MTVVETSHASRQRTRAIEYGVHAATIATIAADCLHLEARTFPKPGLVSHHDCGSHTDMDAATLQRGILAIEPYFGMFAVAGSNGATMAELRTIGKAAEAAMLVSTDGVNTHRGAIFGLGLLCAGAGARKARLADPQTSLGTIVARRWATDIVTGSGPRDSHGAEAWRRFGARGARFEAARGFPSIYLVGLPAFVAGARLAPRDAEAARVQACFALIAGLEDTNILHRGGLVGLRFAQAAAHGFIAAGGVGQPGWREHAQVVHRAFVARRLSPGGSADLLAMSLFVRAYEAYDVRRSPEM